MAAALIPALQAGGQVVVRNLPTLVRGVKQALPAAYQKTQEYFNKSQSTIEKVVDRTISKNDRFMAQSVLSTFMRNGVPAELVNAHMPMISVEELRSLQIQFSQIEAVRRDAANTKGVQVDGDPDVVLAQLLVSVNRLTKWLQLTPEQLEEFLVFCQTARPSDIKRVEKFRKQIR